MAGGIPEKRIDTNGKAIKYLRLARGLFILISLSSMLSLFLIPAFAYYLL